VNYSKKLNVQATSSLTLHFLVVFFFYASLKISGFPILSRSGFPIEENHDLLLTFKQTQCELGRCPDFVYPRFAYFAFSYLSPSIESIQILSWINTIALSFMFAVLLMRFNLIWQKTLAMLVFSATPIQVLMLTQNVDVFCVLLIFFAARARHVNLSFILLCLAALLKYYPIISLLPFFILHRGYFLKRRIEFALLTLTSLILIAGLILDFLDNHALSKMIIGPLNSFGLQSFYMWFSFYPDFNLKETVASITKLSSYCFFGFTTWFMYKSKLVDRVSKRLIIQLMEKSQLKANRRNPMLADLYFLCSGLFCYIFNMNWDYRLLLILIPAVRISLVTRSKILYIMTATSAFLTQYTFEQSEVYGKWLLQLLGDFTLFFLCGFLLALILNMVLKNRSSFNLSGSI
jgi:hypothetical protein